MRVTSLLLNYGRPANMAPIIDAIRAQSEPSEIIVWDNAGTFQGKADLVIRSSRNLGCPVRWPAIGFVRTPYLWTQDDDWILTDKDLLKKLIAKADERPHMLLSLGGCMLSRKGKAYQGRIPVRSGPAECVHCGVAFCRTQALAKLPVNPLYCGAPLSPDELPWADDMWVAHYVSGYVEPTTASGMRPFNEGANGLSKQPQHMPFRDRAAARLLLGRRR